MRQLKLLLGLLGVLELLAPRILIQVFTRLAYRNGTDLEIRGWVITAARFEGALLATVGLVTLYQEAGRKTVAQSSGDESD